MKLTLYLCFALKAPTNRRDFGLFAFDNTASIFEKGAKGKEKDSSTRCRSAVKSAKHHLCKIWRNLNLDSLQNVRDSKEIKLMPELPDHSIQPNICTSKRDKFLTLTACLLVM